MDGAGGVAAVSVLHGTLLVDGEERVVALSLRDGVIRGTVDGAAAGPVEVRRGDGAILVVVGGRAVRVPVAVDGGRVLLHVRGRVREVERPDGSAGRSARGTRARAGSDDPFVTSPMTGTVASVDAVAGAAAPKGTVLVVVEAMKMQFVVRAPRDVVIAAVRVKRGQSVDIGVVLVEFTEGAPA